MSYYVYKYQSTVNNPSLIVGDITIQSVLQCLLTSVFRNENSIQTHMQVVDTYSAQEIKVKRYLNGLTLITERVFLDQTTAEAIRDDLDIIYADNLVSLTEKGTQQDFSFNASIFEITEQQFIDQYLP